MSRRKNRRKPGQDQEQEPQPISYKRQSIADVRAGFKKGVPVQLISAGNDSPWVEVQGINLSVLMEEPEVGDILRNVIADVAVAGGEFATLQERVTNSDPERALDLFEQARKLRDAVFYHCVVWPPLVRGDESPGEDCIHVDEYPDMDKDFVYNILGASPAQLVSFREEQRALLDGVYASAGAEETGVEDLPGGGGGEPA